MKFRYILLAALLSLLGASLLCVPLSQRVFRQNDSACVVMVVDAGHGGEDGGAVSADGLKESDVNLSVALRLDKLLGLCGIPSKLTRDSDNIAYPDSAATTRQRKRADQEFRAALIRGTEKAVLISIHQNNYIAPGPKGAQVFYGRVPGSREFAVAMQDMLSVLCGDHRKAAPVSDDIYLLRQAACPSILVECGFLSNPEELALLKTDTYRTKLALVLAAGCLRQYRELEAEYGKS